MPRNPEVDAWLDAYDDPMKPVVMRVRKHVLAADSRIAECIKWQSPTFSFEGIIGRSRFNPGPEGGSVTYGYTFRFVPRS